MVARVVLTPDLPQPNYPPWAGFFCHMTGAKPNCLDIRALHSSGTLTGPFPPRRESPLRWLLTVRARDGRLFVQAMGQGKFELFALDARRWFARITPLELHFEGGSGVPPAFMLLQAGQRLRFGRE